MSRSPLHVILVELVAAALFLALAAAASDADVLLQLRVLVADATSLSTWQAGTDPCGGVAACTLGSCSWQHVACDQNRVTQVDLSGLGLQGALPSGWQAPTSLKSLDLSNNRQLCGSLPDALVQRGISTVVKAAGSNVGQACPTRSVSGLKDAAGMPQALDAGAGTTMSSVAKGLLGAGVGVGVLAGAAAASVFFLRRRRASSQEGLISHNLARVHDSVIVTKQKKRVNAAAVNKAGPQAVGPAPWSDPVEGDSPHGPVKERPDLRMVAFADGVGADSAEEGKQRLRADNVQDSVVIIRSRLASGQLSRHDVDSESSSSTSSEGAEQSCSADTFQQDAPGEVAVLRSPGANQLQPSSSKRVSFRAQPPTAVTDYTGNA